MSEPKRGYQNPLRVENVDAKNWRILEKFSWLGSEDDLFTVEAGETTDFATVPWWTQAITPRTGTWTKAAVLHDKMCNLLNEYYKLLKAYEAYLAAGVSTQLLEVPIEPVFSSIDTDAIFRKNARDEGTGPIRAELLWFGVRSGSLINPARRDGWLSTFPRYFFDLVMILTAFASVITFVSWVWPW